MYELTFDPRALKEWRKLGHTVKAQFANKLEEVLENPHIEANRLHSLPNCYKIKLRASGYCLVYQVQDDVITVFVVAIGKREKSTVYDKSASRLGLDN